MKKINIIYEDKEILVIDKPSGILTIKDNKNSKNIYSEVREYLNKKKEKVFIVHRLDKDTSGVLIMAKSEKVKNELQKNWHNFNREYIAITENKPKLKENKLVNYLKENNYHQVYITNDHKNGELAITNYELIYTNNKYSWLKVSIETGKKNQIRVQLANIGCPIIGDKKYNAKTNPINRLGLHASRLTINYKNKEMTFEAKIPDKFSFLKKEIGNE